MGAPGQVVGVLERAEVAGDVEADGEMRWVAGLEGWGWGWGLALALGWDAGLEEEGGLAAVWPVEAGEAVGGVAAAGEEAGSGLVQSSVAAAAVDVAGLVEDGDGVQVEVAEDEGARQIQV